MIFFVEKAPVSTQNISSPQARKILGSIMGAAFLIRLLVFTTPPDMGIDTKVYISQADIILKGGYINFFPNGYPFIIALMKICFKGNYAYALELINVICSTLIIYFSYLLSIKIFNRQSTALVTAFIIAFFPSQLNFVRFLMTEVPFTFLLLAAYYCYYKRKNWLCGLIMGVATLIRFEMFMILILLVLCDIINSKKINFLLIITAIIPMLMLGYYSYVKTGEFLLEGNSRFNTIIAASASGSNIDFHEPERHPEINTNAKATKMYMDSLKTNPVKFAKNRLANLWELWGFYHTGPDATSIAKRTIQGIGNLFLLVFGLPAWWKNQKNYNAFITIIPFAVVSFVHVMYFAAHRFVCPVEPFLIILTAFTITKYAPASLQKYFNRFDVLPQQA